jgi:hypothetical protein
MKDKIKWLFSIAGKNDIPKEQIYEYIKRFGKDSIRDLTEAELDDTLMYVSDSRLVKNEKQICLIEKKAASIMVCREHLDRLSHKFGSHTLEELDESGLRGILSILATMERNFLSHLPVIEINEEMEVVCGASTILTEDRPTPGNWVARPDGNKVRVCAERYLQSSIEKIADSKHTYTRTAKKDIFPVRVAGTVVCWGSGKVSITIYRYNSKAVGLVVCGKIMMGDIYDRYSSGHVL